MFVRKCCHNKKPLVPSGLIYICHLAFKRLHNQSQFNRFSIEIIKTFHFPGDKASCGEKYKIMANWNQIIFCRHFLRVYHFCER